MEFQEGGRVEPKEQDKTNMKPLFICFMLAVFLLACKHGKQKVDKENKVMVGLWEICAISSFNGDTESSEQFNVCPEINFLNDFSGFIKLADNSKVSFSWNVERGHLRLTYPKNDKIKDNILANGVYKIISVDKSRVKEIVLLDSMSHTKYFLGKN